MSERIRINLFVFGWVGAGHMLFGARTSYLLGHNGEWLKHVLSGSSAA